MTVLNSESMELRTSEDIVLVRQAVRKKAVGLGFGLVDQTKVVTASSELARNMLNYGGGGTVQLEVVQNDRRSGLRLIFEDQGPGIPDIELAMKDGYTSGQGMGLGLGGAKRLSHEFEILSKVGEGHQDFDPEVEVGVPSPSESPSKNAAKLRKCGGSRAAWLRRSAWTRPQTERVAIVATEACTNLLKHAAGGEILLRNTGTDDPNGLSGLWKSWCSIRVPAWPIPSNACAMASVPAALRDRDWAPSSRLSAEADLYSDLGRGTAVARPLVRRLERERPRRRERPPQREEAAHRRGQRVASLVRKSAATRGESSRSEASVSDPRGGWPGPRPGSSGSPPWKRSACCTRIRTSGLPNCSNGAHQALRSTRGAAISVARIDLERGVLAFAGVGNVSAQIYSGARASQHLVSVNGTAGHQCTGFVNSVIPGRTTACW